MRRHSDTLRGANATTKEEVNGGENTRTSFLRSEGVVVPVKSEPKLVKISGQIKELILQSIHSE